VDSTEIAFYKQGETDEINCYISHSSTILK